VDAAANGQSVYIPIYEGSGPRRGAASRYPRMRT